MNETTRPVPPTRILVALDASPASMAALRSAAHLAALMDAELEGLFVEDANLLVLCDFPFCAEIGSHSGRVRRLSEEALERQLRGLAGEIERSMQHVASELLLNWRFQVRRGQVVSELLKAAQEAALMGLGRASHPRPRALGSTTQSIVRQSSRPLIILGDRGGPATPLTVVYTGTPAAKRALELARDLAKRHEEVLRVLVLPPAGQSTAQVEEEVRSLADDCPVRFLPLQGNVYTTLHTYDGGTLVLPSDRAALITEFDGPVLLVP